MQSVDEVNQDRRRLLGTAAMAAAATQLGTINPAAAQGAQAKCLQSSQERIRRSVR